MKKPEREIEFRDVIYTIGYTSELSLGDVLKYVDKDEWSKVIIHHESLSHEDILTFCIKRIRANPDYEKELMQYEAHVARQKSERLAIKMKAKEELEARLARLNSEIDEMG